MIRHRANMLAPPPPTPEMAESPAYRALPASARALLLMLDIEIANQGGMIASIDLNAACEATGMDRPALEAALGELSQAGFIITAADPRGGGSAVLVALSSRWRT